MNNFNLYLSKKYQVASEVYYPREITIDSIDALKEANRKDFMMSKMKGDLHRCVDNFEKCNVLYGDSDDGKTLKELQKIFKGIEYYVTTSRNHQKPKKGIVCDRFHLFFPLGRDIESGNQLEVMLHSLSSQFNFFDANAIDIARFYYGNENTEVYYYEGESIETILNTDLVSAKESSSKYFEDADIRSLSKGKIAVGSRNSWLTSKAGKYRAMGFNDKKILVLLLDDNQNDFEEPLEESEVQSIARSMMRYEAKSKEQIIEYFEANYIKLLLGGKVCIVPKSYPNTSESITDKANFLAGHTNPEYYYEEIEGKKTIMKSGALSWFNDTKYYKDGFVFCPTTIPSENAWNLWNGFSVNPIKNGKSKSFFDFIKTVICSNNEEHYAYLVSLLAHIIQKPEEKEGIAVALRGDEGVGKTFFVEHFGKLFGKSYIAYSDPEKVVGKFNAGLTNKIIVLFEEAFSFFGGSDGNKQKGALKDLITGSSINIEYKGKESYTSSNLMRFFFSSNNDWIVPVEKGARRYFVLDVANIHRIDNKYFKGIDDDLNNGGYEDFLYELQHMDISQFNYRVIPHTQAKADQAFMTAEPMVRFLVDQINTGCFDIISRVVVGEMLLDYNTTYHTTLSPTSLGMKLRKILGDNYKRNRYRSEKEDYYYYQFPQKEELKKILEEYQKDPLPWQDIDIITN